MGISFSTRTENPVYVNIHGVTEKQMIELQKRLRRKPRLLRRDNGVNIPVLDLDIGEVEITFYGMSMEEEINQRLIKDG